MQHAVVGRDYNSIHSVKTTQVGKMIQSTTNNDTLKGVFKDVCYFAYVISLLQVCSPSSACVCLYGRPTTPWTSTIEK